MEKNLALEVRDKKIVYLNGKPLIPDAFDDVLEFKDYLIAYNSDLIVFIHPNGHVVTSMRGKLIIVQVYDYGKYISLRRNNVMGIYRYDGTIVVPFEFHMTFISDKGFEVKKNEGDNFVPYLN